MSVAPGPPAWFETAVLAVALDCVIRELLLFSLFWFLLGALDELAIDAVWAWQRWRHRRRTPVWPLPAPAHLPGPVAVLVPAWSEADVIGTTITCMLQAWPQPELRLYIGCYRNDSPTIRAAMAAAGGDARVRIVVSAACGPTTKADCLNRLALALADDERAAARRFRAVVFHDAEDMVHPLALTVIMAALAHCDFVQLPVRPEPHPAARRCSGNWIAGHYCDEFAEAHAKAMPVREAVGAGLPGAGVGCGIARAMLDRLAEQRRGQGLPGPFAAEALTEDYELGLLVARLGGTGRFLRLRDPHGTLIATRALFPDQLGPAVRQKTRWIHGIALQGWDRLGWASRPVDVWMALRDRRGPLTALVLAAAYLLLLLEALRRVLPGPQIPHADPMLRGLLWACLASLAWRAMLRAVFTAREYGVAEGFRAILRIPFANVVLMMAGRRALLAYLAVLRGAPLRWEKTVHQLHCATVPSPTPGRTTA
jgi:adsorption protein B